MRPDDVRPVETTILDTRVRLYFLKLDDEKKYGKKGSLAAVIDKVLEEPIRQGMVIFAIGPTLSRLGGRLSGLRIVAADTRGEYDIKKAVAEYRSNYGTTDDSTKDCEACEETDCPAHQTLSSDTTVDEFPDAGTGELLGAPSWETIEKN